MQDVGRATGRYTLTIARSTVMRFAVDVADASQRVGTTAPRGSEDRDGQHRAASGQLHRNRIATTSAPVGFCWLPLALAWPLLGLCLALARLLLGSCLALAWLLLGSCLALAWLLLGLAWPCLALLGLAWPCLALLGLAWPLRRRCVAAASPLRPLRIAAPSPPHRAHITATSPLLHRCNFVQDAAPRHTRRCGA
ncbi:hypothetical protein C6T71_22260 [Burkholderia multivorans]|nr:hypothetical protein C6T71_22260 [Burkholderia multivorans]